MAMDIKQPIAAKDEEFDAEKAKQVKDLEESKLKLMKEIEDLRSKISTMDSNLVEVSIPFIGIRIWGRRITLKLHVEL